MRDAIEIDHRWYIPATSSRADDRTRVLKSDDGFAVFSRHGEIGRVGLGEQGFYYLGTRHLSEWQLLVAGAEPLLLNSTVRLDNSRLVVDQTAPDLWRDDRLWLARGSLHLRRELAAEACALTEELKVTNYARAPLQLRLEYRFGADFRDLFEVRGERRKQRGERLAPVCETQAMVLGYTGLDGATRRTRVEFDIKPLTLDAQQAVFLLDLPPGETRRLEARISGANAQAGFRTPSHAAAVRAIDRKLAASQEARAGIFSDNEQFNDWINRSLADLQMLVTATEHGPYPYAGVPWFSTPFGRDGLITALQTLWLQPDLARGVLRFLAATQADHTDLSREAEPGKILHEMRQGEMAALGEVPFDRYYGTVDATPLFVILAGRYYRRTSDLDFIRTLWLAIERALGWMETAADERGFLTYARHGDSGLVQQGWKDSNDSVFHADGGDAEPPIALCEVQGYASEAFALAAELAAALELPAERQQHWREKARQLRARIEDAFWSDTLGGYALALDGHGCRCEVRTTNPAHLLYCGAVRPERAAAVARGLVSPQSFNGWGARTLFAGEVRYNPMSYHNGSVWPHDTAIAAAGLARYGFMDEALTLFTGLFNAAIFFDLHRLPELFCGFERLPGQAPTLYPVACAPQAWAAGAVFMLLESLLGLSFEPAAPHIRLRHPRLPDYIDWLRIDGLVYGKEQLNLVLRRYGRDVAVNVERGERSSLSLSVLL
ncbi:Amylo-alpha-1,6-glucosidase [Thiorhodovibrio winogradskyi]|uniref:Amylo-alpha-1,6-glucosidase n=1 Tax=Thiorhodovibrio winogradskyi TaxID=77007 RepID=A0ABZ0S835_9GAMM|nr:glycogen debranching N-terminal domain-containing protein [Thiorhodovibrio winogradskyi]